MKVELIKIGNSRGIRLPKSVIEQCSLTKKADLEVEHGRIIIKPIAKARTHWAQAFEEMHVNGDDQLLDPQAFGLSSWDEKEWEW